MITIKTDGTVEPFGLKWLRDSRFQLLAPTRDKTDSSDEFDGEVDFGTELSSGIVELKCVTEEGLSIQQKINKKTELAGLFNSLRNGDWLIWESDPDKKLWMKLDGRVEVQEYPSWLQVNIPLKVDPLWFGINEKTYIGSGLLINEGTFETPVVVEVRGIVTNPEISIGGKTLRYEGTVGETDLLVIDTDKMTVTFNGINAMASFTGSFPKLPPGETEVIAPANGTTTFKWRDCWI